MPATREGTIEHDDSIAVNEPGGARRAEKERPGKKKWWNNNAKTGTAIYSAMAGVSRIKSGGSSNLMEMLVCKLAYSTWLLPHGGRSAKRHAPTIKNSSTAIASAIGHCPT